MTRILSNSFLSIFLLAAGVTKVFAGSDLNEVGAFLVYPSVTGVNGQETFITVTNVGSLPITVHVAYINGNAGSSSYCQECDFSIPLSGNDTETFVVTSATQGGLAIQSESDGDGTNAIQHSCPYPYGMITVNPEDSNGRVITDNVLLGEQIVVNYLEGYAYSIPAIPFQGRNGGDGNRTFRFDDVEYGKLPRVIAADFIAPDIAGGPIRAELTLFTPGFERQFPPSVDCSIVGYDADENPFSRSIRFGCWASMDLCAISPEFCYPNLGHFLGQRDTHGWFLVNCRVDQDGNGQYESNGGVHGALVQIAEDGSVLRRKDPLAPALNGSAAWARVLYQSVTTGDAVNLILTETSGGF